MIVDMKSDRNYQLSPVIGQLIGTYPELEISVRVPDRDESIMPTV